MNWEKLYDLLIISYLLDGTVSAIENGRTFKTVPNVFEASPVSLSEIESTGKRFRTADLFKFKFEKKTEIGSREYYLTSFKGLQVHAELFRNNRKKIRFYDSDFLYNMQRAAEVSSGFSHFAEAVHEISNSLGVGIANLNGSWCVNEADLNEYLDHCVYAYKEVYKSVQEINDYINGPLNI
jgi:hypothetical protein